ncbi:MAG: response regulator transcription factor [Candidatus Acidiferrales bacterium]
MPRPGTARKRIGVLIADADNVGSELMASALQRCHNYFDVVARASSATEAISKLDRHKPDVALVSPELLDGPQTGFEVLKKLRESHSNTVAVMLLPSSKPESVIDSFRTGARGVFIRANSFKSLSKCIRTVHGGQIWASNKHLEYMVEALTHLNPLQFSKQKGLELLSQREKEVIRLAAEGMKNREIAAVIGVTEHTVSNYMYRIFDKLGVSSRVELIMYVVSHQSSAE